jgi:GAF domain-containing protein/anti-sigma regulatory factor (Ser/Thr protein kinase)
MRRRANSAKTKVQRKQRRSARKTPTAADARVRDLEVRLAESLKREAEGLERQTATADILRAISSSPADIQPVFDIIGERAEQLCDAAISMVSRFDGEQIHLVALHGVTGPAAEVNREAFPQRPDDQTLSARAVRSRAVAHVADVLTDPLYPQKGAARASGQRASLAVPMIQDNQVIGVIFVARTRPGLFTDNQVDLLKTFANQAVIAVENVRLFKALEARNKDLTEALDQQTATSEVLEVISRSTFDLEPVLRALIENATRLCSAANGQVFRFDGELLHLGVEYGSSPEYGDYGKRHPIRPGPGSAAGRAATEGRTIHIEDVLADPDYHLLERQKLQGYRTIVAVPMRRETVLVGVLVVWRRKVEPFTARQIELLKTFADQAVIAIENVRLFTELQEKNRALTDAHAQVTEALDQQTATAGILRVISSSPTSTQPVFDAILDSATRLCAADHGILYHYDGEVFQTIACHRLTPDQEAAFRSESVPPGPYSGLGRLLAGKRPVQVADVTDDIAYRQGDPRRLRFVTLLGARSAMWVPLLKNDVVVGAMAIYRREMRPFPDKQIELVATFADQAVIAIENVRLFNDTKAALERQMATSDILRVISRSPTDVQPVFDTIAESAVRLCGGLLSGVYRFDGELIHFVAQHNWTAEGLDTARSVYPRPPSRDTQVATAILDRAVVHIPDFDAPGVPAASLPLARALGYRSILVAPMLREGDPIGAIAVARAQAGAFPGALIALLETFADQAVIAIENVRLFTALQTRTSELSRSVDELTALGDVGRALSSTLDFATVLETIVTRANALAGTDGCSIYEYDEMAEVFRLRASNYADPRDADTLDPIGRTMPIPRGQGAASRAAALRQPIQIPDIGIEGAYESPIRGSLLQAGYRAILTVPLLLEDQVIGAVSISRKTPGEFAPEIVRLLTAFATQSALAIQNARLFEEIAGKSRQLEAASRHKSEFLANMSHELRTPLNAVIGFSEVLLQRMFGDLNPKQDEYLKDIYGSGQHLLSLINDILDLSKIEAGGMELAPAPFHLPGALDNAVSLVKERASRHGIALELAIDPVLGEIVGDERKVKQVLLNLLSNAVKFTPEGGRISLKASRKEGAVEIAVTDTGVGIAPEDQAAIFEEFRQVGHDETRKQEGTGLGLTLAKKFVELHGGRIWVESAPGRGSTFTFMLPAS